MPEPVVITLTREELTRAGRVGVERQARDYARRRPDQAGFDSRFGAGWAVACEGACGEMAVAKLLGLPWSPSLADHDHGRDVGKYQVRTGQPGGRYLIVREKDKDDDIFILVISEVPSYRVVGWIAGRDAKRPGWLTSKGTGRPAAYFVPASELRPIRELTEND